MPRRSSFLPAFFTVLAVAFALAVAFRIRNVSTSSTRQVANSETSAVTGAGAKTGSSGATDVDANVRATSASTTEMTQRDAERERRYRELLGEEKPAARQAEPEKPLVPRVVAPAARVFGATSQPATASTQRARGQGSNGPGGTGPAAGASTEATGGGREKTDTSTDAKDTDSDTTPPQLLGATFDPPAIEDGTETVLTIVASDDLSGIRTISGNILSPAGALQGFAAEQAGDTNQYTATIAVPKEASEGMWHVNFLSLTDGASNSITLTWRMGQVPQSAQFMVKSAKPDTTKPTLRNAWLDKPAVRAGEKDTLFVEADDDNSGVKGVTGVFVSPTKLARIAFGCSGQDGGTWACEIAPQAAADCGEWQLEQLQIQDNANNLLVAQGENPIVAGLHLAVSSDACDSKAPTVTAVALEPPAVSAPGAVNVSVEVTDDSSGVASVSGHFLFTGTISGGAQPPQLYFSCRAGSNPTTWSGSVIVGAKNARGIWRLASLQVMDKAGNLKVYAEGDPVIANVAFRVQ